MRSLINKLVRGQEGQAMIIVLVLLLVGGLIVAPLLSYIYTGVKVGEDVYEERTLSTYAAEAGVEYGLQQIIDKAAGLPEAPNETLLTENLDDDVNGKSVGPIIVTYISETDYGINATAIDSITGDITRIQSRARILSFKNFMDNAVTSMSDVEAKSGSTVNGTIQYNGEFYTPPNPDQFTHIGSENTSPIEGWPNLDDLIKYYEALGTEDPYDEYPYDTIDISELESIGPIYRDGDLDIINTGDTTDNITLTGTIWVTGKLTIATTRQDFLLNLNGNTIFVEDPTIDENEWALEVGPQKPTITGSGCIVVVGNIKFMPNMASDPDDYVFIISVLGKNRYQPSGDFYGSVAGNTIVELWPGNNLMWRPPPPGLHYPGAEPSDFNVIQEILQWIIYELE